MSTCTITSATLDKATYNAGDTMTLTVVRSAAVTTEQAETIQVDARGADGTQAAAVTVSLAIDVETPQASTVTVADSTGRTWTAGADDGMTASFTATA